MGQVEELYTVEVVVAGEVVAEAFSAIFLQMYFYKCVLAIRICVLFLRQCFKHSFRTSIF